MEHIKVDVNRLVEQETVVYFDVFDDATMTARAAVGRTKVDTSKSKKRVITMTEEVLELANSCMAQLGLLQEEYVELHQQQRAEEEPPFKGAWGKMHVMSALLQQLRTEVDEELEEKRKTGKPITVYDKRNAWKKRANNDWRCALRVNAKADKTTSDKLAESTNRNHAAAAMIQTIWRSRQQRKNATKRKHLQESKALQRQVQEAMTLDAGTMLREQTMLGQREQNVLRKKQNISLKTFGTMNVAYDGRTGSLQTRADDVDEQPDDEDVLQLSPLEEDSDDSDEEMEVDDQQRESSAFKALQKKRNDKAKRAITGSRLAALAAPKQVIDLDARHKEHGSGTVWKGGGAFQKKASAWVPSHTASFVPKQASPGAPKQATAGVPKQHSKQNESFLQRGMLQRKVSNIVQTNKGSFHGSRTAGGHQPTVSIVSLGDGSAHSPWHVLRSTVIATTRLGRLKQAAMPPKSWRSWKTIPATKSMKSRVGKLQQQFDRFSDKVDSWVKANKHILDLIVHDDLNPSGKTDDETVSDARAQKELVGHQILVMSSMWAVMKQNLMQMQEKILGFAPGRPQPESDNFSRDEMKDGTATVMKMWRDLSESASPFSVALGNHDPEELIARMMTRAKEDDRTTKSKQQQGQSFRTRLRAFSVEGTSDFKQMGYTEQQEKKQERQQQLAEERQRIQAQQAVIKGGLPGGSVLGTSLLHPLSTGGSRDGAEPEQNSSDIGEAPQDPVSRSLPSESLPDAADIRSDDVPPESGGTPAPASSLGVDADRPEAPRSDAAAESAAPPYGLGGASEGFGISHPTSSNATDLPNRNGGPDSDAIGTSRRPFQGSDVGGLCGEKLGGRVPEPARERDWQPVQQPGVPLPGAASLGSRVPEPAREPVWQPDQQPGVPLSGVTSEDLAITGAGRASGLKRPGSTGVLPRISEDGLDFVPNSAAPTVDQLLLSKQDVRRHTIGHQTASRPSNGLPPRPIGKDPSSAGPNLRPTHAGVSAQLNPSSAISSPSTVPNGDGLSLGAQRGPAEAALPAGLHPHQRQNFRPVGGDGFGFAGDGARRLASRNTQVKNLVNEVDQLFHDNLLPSGKKAPAPAAVPKAEHKGPEPVFMKRPDTVGVLQPVGQLKAHTRPGFQSPGPRLPFEYRNNSTAQHMRQSLPDIRSGAVQSPRIRSKTAEPRSVPLAVSMGLTTEYSWPSTMPNYLGPLKGINPNDVRQRLASPAWHLDKSRGLQPSPTPKSRLQ